MGSIIKNLVMVFVLLSCVITFSGCIALAVGAAAGVGGYAWANGDVEKEFDQSLDRVYKASLAGFKKLEIAPKKTDKDKLEASIQAELTNGNDLKITIKALSEKRCRLKIRVGLIGDRDKSLMILDAIEDYL